MAPYFYPSPDALRDPAAGPLELTALYDTLDHSSPQPLLHGNLTTLTSFTVFTLTAFTATADGVVGAFRRAHPRIAFRSA